MRGLLLKDTNVSLAEICNIVVLNTERNAGKDIYSNKYTANLR
jgi:hypothetical protein